ncbi:MAG: AGE family epimerase/isomerase, partial [Pseudomonadota bacterium]
EASLAQVRAGDARYEAVAEECLALCKDVFLTRDVALLEYFYGDWRPVETNNWVEPGHMAEWTYLLADYEKTMGRACGVDLPALFEQAEKGLGDNGLLSDEISDAPPTYRLWPQTEYAKAALVMAERGSRPPVLADEIIKRLIDVYLSPPVKGGWWDQYDAGGTLTSEVMPASSFYHILSAFLAYLRAPD